MTVPALIAAIASEVIRRGDHRPEIAAVHMTMPTSFNTFKKAIIEPVRVQFWSQASWMAWNNSFLKNECSNALLELVQFWSQASWMAWNNSFLKNECSNALLALVQFWSQAWMAWNNSFLKNECSLELVSMSTLLENPFYFNEYSN